MFLLLIHNFISLKLKIGMTTEEIDKTVHEYIISHGAYPSPLHYKGFPKSICTSINNVVCHGTAQYNNVVSLFF